MLIVFDYIYPVMGCESQKSWLLIWSGCCSTGDPMNVRISVYLNAKQKHPGCKKSARPIRSSIANRYVRPKTLISVEAKKLLIKNLLE